METSIDDNRPSVVKRFFRSIGERYQSYLDGTTLYVSARWTTVLIYLALYGIRVIILKGWYIISYALGIYILNLFIAFLSPAIDPSVLESNDEDGPSLPTRSNEEFKPFMRRLPEFKFWYSMMKATTVGMICTCFDAMNIPVFWPILVMYFFILFTITMKRQIKHMITFRYLPFTYGKTKYKGREDGGKISAS